MLLEIEERNGPYIHGLQWEPPEVLRSPIPDPSRILPYPPPRVPDRVQHTQHTQHSTRDEEDEMNPRMVQGRNVSISYLLALHAVPASAVMRIRKSRPDSDEEVKVNSRSASYKEEMR